MKALPSRIPRSLPVGAVVTCDDNSGAKIVQIIGIKGWHAKRNRYPAAGIGDVVSVAVKKGNPQMRKKIERAVVIRQRKEIRRGSGVRVKFEDNAVVLIDEQGLPKGTEIKGAVAREVAERFPKVVGIAGIVV